jgi:flagellar motor protein MotB
MIRVRTGLVVGLLCISGFGCQNKLQDENTGLWKQNRELQAKLRDAESQRDARPDQTQYAQLQGQLAQRDQQIADLQNQLRAPQPGASAPVNESLAGIEVTRDDRAGTLTVNVPGDVLFPSGQAELKESAKATLNKVASAIKKDYGGKKILIQGYTDPDPISRTKDKWKDNLDLSAARARAVANYLSQQGIDTKKVGLQAYGDTVPKNSKDRSRRVEIVVSTRD